MRSCLLLLKRGDFAIIGIVLCSVVISFAALYPWRDDDQLEIVVSLAGEEIYRQAWRKGDNYTIDLSLPQGITAYLDVNSDGVEMQSLPTSVCPAQICSHTGRICKPGQIIVCLPNRIIVEIERANAQRLDFDGITQ